MYRRILVPLDCTHFGDQALPYAVAVARRTGASIELVHVHRYAERDAGVTAMPQYQYEHVMSADQQFDADVRLSEQRQLEQKAAALAARHGVAVTTRLLSGPTDEAIAGEAGDIVADLIVMSTHARTGLARIRHGSIAHALIGQLNVPALCIHATDEPARRPAPQFDRVVIPLDGSAFSEQILDAVAPLLRALGAQPTLVHVISPRPLLGSGFTEAPRTIASRDQALAYLHEVADRWRSRIPHPVLIALEDAQPANLIAALLDAGEYDMAAMATHGRGGLSGLIMGSVADGVLAATVAPVLLYRPRLARLPDPELAARSPARGD